MKGIDVLIAVHIRDLSRPDQELLPPYHIDFKDLDGRSFGYLFGRILNERTKFLEPFGVSRLGGIKKVEATFPYASYEKFGAEMRRGHRTEYKLEGIADWFRMEKLWRDFLEDTKDIAEFGSRERGQGRWNNKEEVDEDLCNGPKDVGKHEDLVPHCYAKVILYFWPEYEV